MVMRNEQKTQKHPHHEDDKISLYTFFNYKFDILHEDNQKLQKQIQTILINQQENQQQLTNHEDRITVLESSYEGAWSWIKTIGAGVIVALILDILRWIR